MVETPLVEVHLSRKRFFINPIKLRKWEPESDYKWEVVDSRGEVKPQRFIFKRDAESAVSRLKKQHENSVKVARNNVRKGRVK